MKTPFIVFSLFVLLFLSSVERTYACVCVEDKNASLNQKVRDAYKNSAAVFSGQVVGIRFDADAQVAYITIQVSDAWKGNLPSTITIVTIVSPESCEFRFALNANYLIYAIPEGNMLSTNICLRTALIANTPDIPILNKITRRTP